MTEAKRATAAQWKTLASLSKQLGARSATHLAALALDCTERELRDSGLSSELASKVISAAIPLAREKYERSNDAQAVA